MNDEDDDALLTGFVDGELDEKSSRKLRARLSDVIRLRARLEAIEAGGRPLAAAFAALLDEAPVERMKVAMTSIAPPTPLWRTSARALAASVALIAFLAGVSLGWLTPHPGSGAQGPRAHEDWRDAVAEYAALYTRETFAHMPAAEAVQGPALSVVSAKLGIDLAPDRTKVDGLAFKAAILLAYDGAPLGELAYADAEGSPVLFCIIADARPDAARVNQTRNNFALTTWAHGGRGYMVIAQLPTDKVAEIAGELQRRF